ncbi:DUF805 domain-containing protein [Spirochaeta isovalerica]|uniref:Uncharacterized membrane protein YhaH (DUF805 family) n=1 Tax=Spirochaeta isovalerica TaxID=150 RepID=A0A841RBE8_9SPIO|nr:DUF805 domain-containing protein [Spirochaeta isovalerica]MBB6482734.1 uncharacterized membrane protein YhaH (DUF805 family) [Spirochaeta isovalerica]
MTARNFLFSYKGRISRSNFWAFYMGAMFWQLASAFLMGLDNIIANAFGIISFLVLIYSIFAVYGKRWHDRGKSAKWNFICLIPGIGAIWATIECGFLKGNEGENEYGLEPYKDGVSRTDQADVSM